MARLSDGADRGSTRARKRANSGNGSTPRRAASAASNSRRAASTPPGPDTTASASASIAARVAAGMPPLLGSLLPLPDAPPPGPPPVRSAARLTRTVSMNSSYVIFPSPSTSNITCAGKGWGQGLRVRVDLGEVIRLLLASGWEETVEQEGGRGRAGAAGGAQVEGVGGEREGGKGEGGEHAEGRLRVVCVQYKQLYR
eukprot:75012-Chlamydomonas_euryale.AAC.2